MRFLQRSLQRLLRACWDGDVHRRPDKLEVALLISYGLRHNVDVFDGTARHHESMFKIEVRAVAGCAIECLSHEDDVVRTNSSEYLFDRRLSRSIESNHSIRFI